MAKIKTADEPVATPENTPLPGGGSWHWDYTRLEWVENPPYGEAQIAPVTPAQPAPAEQPLE